MFDSLWHLAAERQRMFRDRLLSLPFKTEDPILRSFKFTNAYRASDRTSQFLIRQVIYDRKRSWRDTFIRVLLFKVFNKIETWQRIERELGDVSATTFEVDAIQDILDRAFATGTTLYSAAYIMPSAMVFGSRRKHRNHIALLDQLMRARVDDAVLAARTMREVFDLLVAWPSLGPFLAYQYAIDLNYGPQLALSESEFVMPGPGARDGLSKCFSDAGDLDMADLIRWTTDTQEHQFVSRDIEFADLWNRPLQLIDCQSLYCEVSKYARVAHPEYVGRSVRSRIKQRFRPRPEPVSAWYPPKWKINANVSSWLAAHGHPPSAIPR